MKGIIVGLSPLNKINKIKLCPQKVKEMTNGEIIISAGTMYGTLTKMAKDGLISFHSEDEKRKLYIISDLGREILNLEI